MTIAEQVRANQNVNEMLERSINILAKLENKTPEQVYNELEEGKMELTNEELVLMKDIAEGTLTDLGLSELKKETRELLDSYSKVLDLGGDSIGIAEEVLKDILKAETLRDLSLNGLSLLQVIYRDGVKGCDKLLGMFSMRGLHEDIRTRRGLLVSTIYKVDQECERQEKLFSSEPLSLQEETDTSTEVEKIIEDFRELDVEVTRQENGLYRTLDLGSGYEITDLTEQDLMEAYYTFPE